MTMTTERKLVYAVLAVLVVGVLLWVQRTDVGQEPQPTPVGGASGVPAPTGGVSKPGSAMPQTYADAVARYEGNRYQFDQTCQTKPAQASYKNGATVMLDNRSGDARVITVGGIKYNLAGYGWRIIILSSAKLPATLGINCGSAVNVAQIQLYK